MLKIKKKLNSYFSLNYFWVNFGLLLLAYFLSIVFGYLILSRWYNQDRIEITPNGVMRHAKVLLGGENTYKFEKTEEDIVRDVRISTVGSNHSIIVSKNGHRKSMIASLKSHSFAMTVTEAIRIIWQSQKEE